MSIRAIVRIRTPHWANAFARRRLEHELDGVTGLSGHTWVIDYAYAAAHTPTSASVESTELSQDDRNTIVEIALRSLARQSSPTGDDYAGR